MPSKPISHLVGILSLSRVFAFAVVLFVPMVNVRALSVEQYGYYRQFWLLFNTLVPILILGFPRSLLYYFPRSENDAEKSVYVTQTVAYLFIVSLVAVVVYTVMGKVLGAGLGAMVRLFYGRLCLFTVFMLLSRHLEELFVADEQVERQAAYYVISEFLRSATVIAVSWYTRDVNAIVWALLLYAIMRGSFALIYTWLAYRPSIKQVSFSTMREQLSFALPLGMMAITTILLTQTDKFIINRFMGREAFAVYSIGAFKLPFTYIVATSVSSVAFPLMAKYQKEELFEEFSGLWRRAWLKTAVLFFPIFVFFMVTAERFIVILFTEAYSDAIPVFRIYVILFLKATTDYAGVLTAFKKQDYLFKVMAVAVVANIVLSVALYKTWGRLGVPLSTTVSFFAVALLAVRKGGQLLRQSFWQTVPWRGLTTRMATAVVPGALLYYFYARGDDFSLSGYAVAGAAYFAAYFLLCWAFRLLKLEDVKSLLGRK